VPELKIEEKDQAVENKGNVSLEKDTASSTASRMEGKRAASKPLYLLRYE